MIVLARTGLDPRKMTFIRFIGIIDRICSRKLNRYEVGGGVTAEELMTERMAEKMRADREED